MKHTLKQRLFNSLYLDHRSIGLFRILIGIIILVDYLLRVRDFKAFYTEEGVLPLRVVLEDIWILNLHWSVFHLTQNNAVILLFFLVGIFLSIALIVGFKTRYVIFFSWILLVSVHNRNSLINNAGDTLLQLLVFWSVFLPLDKKFSWKKGIDLNQEDRLISIPAAAIIIQIVLVYFFSALHKDHMVWKSEGSALYYALNIDQMVKPLGRYLLNFPLMLKGLTYGIYYLELLGPLLLFIPFRNTFFRYLAIVLFILFHLATLLVFELGIFSFVGIAAWTLLLPSAFWNRISREKQKRNDTLTINGNFKWWHLAPAFLIVYVFLWNIRSLNIKKFRNYFPAQTEIIAHVFQLQQKWAMFAPYPFKNDGWFIVEAEMQDGSKEDLLSGNDLLNYSKPENILSVYENKRWQKFFWSMYFNKNRKYADHYLTYVCHTQARQKGIPSPLKSIRLLYMKEVTPAPGENYLPVTKIVLARKECF